MRFPKIPLKTTLQEIEAVTESTGRVYTTPDGKKYPSVTTVLGYFKAQKIAEWRQRVGEEEANKISRKATTRGTRIHTIAENYINGVEWKEGCNPIELQSFEDIRKILDARLEGVILQEAPLYSDFLKTAGRVDLVGVFDGKRSIIDFKTSLKVKKPEYIKDYFMQESFYAVAFEERTGIPINQLVTIISVDHENPQVFIERRDTHIRDFMAVRESYRAAKGI